MTLSSTILEAVQTCGPSLGYSTLVEEVQNELNENGTPNKIKAQLAQLVHRGKLTQTIYPLVIEDENSWDNRYYSIPGQEN